MGKIGIILLGVLATHLCYAQTQTYFHIDTIPTQELETHLFLTIESPSGTMFFRSSGECGQSIHKLSTKDSGTTPRILSQSKSNSYLVRTVKLNEASTRDQMGARMRIQRGFTPKQVKKYVAEYRSDPNLVTDLHMNLGYGGSRMDLSGLSLKNVKINSAFSDVLITYTEPNQLPMEVMDIHAATANIILKNIEYARAEMINVRNDVGDIKLLLGENYIPKTNIMIMSGAGECTLIIHKNQPTKIILKSGIFSKVDFTGEFNKHTKGIYTNAAYDKHPEKGSVIICETDLGTIHVIESK